jgi:hypothetical protein
MKKLTCSRMRYLMKDEKKASKEYRKYGFKGLSKDEARHRRFLLKKYNQRCK